MHEVSDLYKEASGYGYALALTGTLDGASQTLTYDNLLSFKLSGNATSEENLAFGYASACEVSFSIDNIDGRWDDTDFDGVVWTLQLGKMLSRYDSELFQVGIFTTTEALVADGAINIKAIDNMQKFEVKFRGINYPCTLHDLVLQCCKQVGVTFRTSSYTNMDFEITGAYQLTQVTCRTIIGLVADLCGCFATINSFGELELRWFDSRSPVATFSSDDISGFKPDKIENTIGGTSVVFNGVEYTYGSGNKKINLTEDNRLLMYCTQQQIHELLVNIFNRNQSMLVYSTASFSSTGEPALQLGDVVSVVDRKGTQYNVLVSSLILSNNLKMEITSPPITVDDDNVSSSTESGSIPRDTSEAVNIYVAKNDKGNLAPNKTVDEFLYQKFSTETGANPVAMITLTGDCTTAGILTARVVVDGSTYIEYQDAVLQGKYLKTLICPIEGLIGGNHSVILQLISDSTLDMVLDSEEKPTAGSVMILQGRKMGEPTSWDGVISVQDEIGKISIARSSIKVVARDVFNELARNDSTGPIFTDTISVKVSRGDIKVGATDSVTTTLT